MGCGQGPLFGSIFVLKDASPDCSGCPLSGVERRSLLGGCLYIKCMLKSIGAFVFGRSREVGRFWEGPLREAPLYTYVCTRRIIIVKVFLLPTHVREFSLQVWLYV